MEGTSQGRLEGVNFLKMNSNSIISLEGETA